MPYYRKNGRTYFRASRHKRVCAPEPEPTRDVDRVRKTVPSNTEQHHKLQKIKQEPVPRDWHGEDEIIAGDDDQRFVRRSER